MKNDPTALLRIVVKCVNYIRTRYPLITYLERPHFPLAVIGQTPPSETTP
jgi:hypothetical protein